MFEHLVAKFESELRSYCRMLTGTPWDTDDLFQDTLLKAFKAREKLYQHPSPRAFLFRVASNAWIDECRKRKADVGLPEGYETFSSNSDEYLLDIKDSLNLLVSAIPPFQAASVLLADVFGYRSREIADMLDTTEGAVKAALHRARKRLNALAQDVDLRDTYSNHKNTEEQDSLIQRFLEAFRMQQPMAIAGAYRLLIQAGIQVVRHSLQGKLYFTFHDPEGNAFSVLAN
ncbi:RNA polymerase sigma factor [Cohnella sp. REN36]|nr:RNA polymerase sigma factor [Cohnella sp. REN36]MCC3373688.1 RNA polymerase sigma factor [Cohnella sp. REN36]